MADSRIKCSILYTDLVDIVKKHLPDPSTSEAWQDAEDDEAVVVAYPNFFVEVASKTQRLNVADIKKALYEMYKCSAKIQSTAGQVFAGALSVCSQYHNGRKKNLTKAPMQVQDVVRMMAKSRHEQEGNLQDHGRPSPSPSPSPPPSSQRSESPMLGDAASLLAEAKKVWHGVTKPVVDCPDSPISIVSSQELRSPDEKQTGINKPSASEIAAANPQATRTQIRTHRFMHRHVPV